MEFASFDDPALTMPQLIAASWIDRATVENWIRYRHIIPALDLPGRARRFSLGDFVQVEVTRDLRHRHLPVNVAADMAKQAVEAYSERGFSDAKSVFDGGLTGDLEKYRHHFGVFHLSGGGLTVFESGDARVPDDVTYVNLVGMLAIKCFRRLATEFNATASESVAR